MQTWVKAHSCTELMHGVSSMMNTLIVKSASVLTVLWEGFNKTLEDSSPGMTLNVMDPPKEDEQIE